MAGMQQFMFREPVATRATQSIISFFSFFVWKTMFGCILCVWRTGAAASRALETESSSLIIHGAKWTKINTNETQLPAQK